MKCLHSVNSSSAQFHLMSSAAASTVLEIHDASSNSNPPEVHSDLPILESKPIESMSLLNRLPLK